MKHRAYRMCDCLGYVYTGLSW